MENPANSDEKNKNIENQSKERINNGFWELIYGISDFFKQMFELQSDLDKEGTIENIKNNKKMQGANVWLLICSIMVACLGLDLNSPAVIIGAMLISPLMSPILGIGLGVGINDKETLYISLKHFGIAVVIALFTSVTYFFLTPFGEMTPEIAARTNPTLLDAMVAIFGGLAGIISSSRRDKSNAIPGVAIATALMPPLCVSGFGIVGLFTGETNWDIFLNSFYLFFLNSVFIALTTYLIVRFLRFPYTSYLNKKEKYRTTLIISIFSIVILIPSATILLKTLRKLENERTLKAKENTIDSFIKQEFDSQTKRCVNFQTELNDSISYIVINYDSKDDIIVPRDTLLKYENILEKRGITNPKIIARGRSGGIIPTKKIGEREEEYNQRISEFAIREAEKDIIIKKQQMQIDSIREARSIETIVDEAKVFLEGLEDVDLVHSKFDSIPILIVKWKEEVYQSSYSEDRIFEFVKLKTGLDTLVVHSLK